MAYITTKEAKAIADKQRSYVFKNRGHYALELEQEGTTFRVELSDEGTINLTMQKDGQALQVQVHPQRWHEMIESLNWRHFPPQRNMIVVNTPE